MEIFLREFFACCLLIMIGCGVSANVLLKGTKAPARPWFIVIFGWAIAYGFSYLLVEPFGGAHINPLVSIAYFILGDVYWTYLVIYFLGQFTGSFIGALMIYFYYIVHFQETFVARRKLQVFLPTPTNENIPSLLFNESVGSFTFVFALLNFFHFHTTSLIIAILISLIVLTTGIAFGSSVNYANNPVRDLGPRLVSFLVPNMEKGFYRTSNLIFQIGGSIIGGIYAALFFQRIVLQEYHPAFWGITILIIANLIWLLIQDRKFIKSGEFKKSS